MNDKERASQLRGWAEIVAESYPAEAEEMQVAANELDPPIPEPGVPILWWHYPTLSWKHAVVECDGFIHDESGSLIPLSDVVWKFARMLGPRQIAVNVPQAWRWPSYAETLAGVFLDNRGEEINPNHRPEFEITRVEADRMEERDE